MKSRVPGAILAALLAASAAATASASMTPVQSLQALTGKWACVLREGSGKPVTTSETLTMQGPWLRFDFTDPGSTVPDSAYLSYDRKHKHWVYMEIDSDGEYGVSSSTSPTYNNAVFHSVYPATGPETGTTAIHVRGTNYMQDVFTYKAGGKTMTASVTCTR